MTSRASVSGMDEVGSAKSLLFVPADRPDRFAKAASSGADAIILDLEDAVGPRDKSLARRHAGDWLSEHPAHVRINAADTEWFDDDMAMVGEHSCPVVVPKVATAEQIRLIVDRLPGVPVTVLLETAAGILNAATICAVAGVARAAFGSVDLGAELGVEPADVRALQYARSATVLASAAAGLPPPLDGVCTDLDDPDSLVAEARRAVSLGFGGKLCIHPRQIVPVNRSFSPTPTELDWARRVVASVDARGVVVLDGKMIDKPVVTRAQRLLHNNGGLDDG